MSAPALLRYFEHDCLPGIRHFHCEPMRASLSTDACARRWREANAKRHGSGGIQVAMKDSDKSCALCKGCRIGAMHAGADKANLHAIHVTNTCARCLKPAPRLINKHLCVSCYNRSREYLLGRNSRGNKPVMHPPLSSHSVSYMAGGELRIRTIELAAERREVIAAVLRDEHDAVTFVEEADREIAESMESLCAQRRRAPANARTRFVRL
jgi:hypothetical protein